jgi:antitoxin YefM
MADITLPISQIRRDLPALVRKVDDDFTRYIITTNGTPKAVLLSYEEFEAIEETLEVLGDPQILADLQQARAARERGETYPLEQIKEELKDAS